MKQPWLPYDVARCHGASNPQCLNCLRRLAPGNPHRQSYLIGTMIDGKCEFRLEWRKDESDDE